MKRQGLQEIVNCLNSMIAVDPWATQRWIYFTSSEFVDTKIDLLDFFNFMSETYEIVPVFAKPTKKNPGIMMHGKKRGKLLRFEVRKK